MGELKVSLFSVVSTAKGERGEFSLLRSINKGKLIFGGPKVKVVGVTDFWYYKMFISYFCCDFCLQGNLPF